MKYRVILKASYIEVNFDFDKAEDCVRFAADALAHMTEREDGKDCTITFTKVNTGAEAIEEEEDKE